MKKRIITILLCVFFSTFCLSQQYERVDGIVLKYPKKFGSVSKLAKQIATDFSTDYDKVRATYTWIANNVSYDFAESGFINFQYYTKEELIEKKKEFNKKLALRVISKGKAVCQGYSTLFTAICDELNITSRVVTGNAKSDVNDIGKKYFSDHAWNIVVINNKEYLIDVTWGAGTYSNRFVKNLNYVYFFTEPKLFIKKHYPDKYEDALLKEKIGQQEFLNGPLIYDHDFELVNPTTGIIKKKEGNRVKFKFVTNKEVNSVSYDLGKKNYDVAEFKNNGTLEFEIDISKVKNEKELVLFFNYESVIAFKLE